MITHHARRKRRHCWTWRPSGLNFDFQHSRSCCGCSSSHLPRRRFERIERLKYLPIARRQQPIVSDRVWGQACFQKDRTKSPELTRVGMTYSTVIRKLNPTSSAANTAQLAGWRSSMLWCRLSRLKMRSPELVDLTPLGLQ
jgi:hypothetical protein